MLVTFKVWWFLVFCSHFCWRTGSKTEFPQLKYKTLLTFLLTWVLTSAAYLLELWGGQYAWDCLAMGAGKKGISRYLKQSHGPSLVTVPTSGHTLSDLPWGPKPASMVSFHSPQVLHCSSQRQTRWRSFTSFREYFLGHWPGGKYHSCLGSYVHKDEVPYLPCSCKGHLLITDSLAPGPFLALGSSLLLTSLVGFLFFLSFFSLTLPLKVHFFL